MFKLYMGYLKQNTKYTVIKIGQTTKTCWSRCKNEDYHICQAVQLLYHHNTNIPKGLSDFLEAAMLFEYRNKYPAFKGNEYFYIENKSKEEIEKEWYNIINTLIKQYCSTINNNDWLFHTGAVEPYTY